MKAIDLLASHGRAIPLHPVTVRLLTPADPSMVAEAPAVLRFVSDRARLAAADSAAESIAKNTALSVAGPPSAERRAQEEAYHLLAQAVRDKESPASVFFESVEQAKSMLVNSEALRLVNEYERYVATHFPESLTEQEARAIAEDARNFTGADLLRSRGYWQILRALPYLAVTFGASLIPTSSPTGSATT